MDSTYGLRSADAPTVLRAQMDIGRIDALVTKLGEVGLDIHAPVQAIRADRIVSRLHVDMASMHARRAEAGGRARSDDIALDFVLYLAGDRQIHRALRDFGVTANTTQDVLLVALRPGGVEELAGAISESLGVEAVPWEPTPDDPACQAARTFWAARVGLPESEAANVERMNEAVLAAMATLAVGRH